MLVVGSWWGDCVLVVEEAGFGIACYDGDVSYWLSGGRGGVGWGKVSSLCLLDFMRARYVQASLRGSKSRLTRDTVAS